MAIVVIDSYTEGTSGSVMYAGSVIASGQSFTCDADFILTSCKFSLRKNNSPTGNAYAYIYAHSGTYGTSSVPTGSPLATSDAFDISTLTTSQAWHEFTFSGVNQINLSKDANYVLVIVSNNGDSTNYITIYQVTTSGHDGNKSTSTNLSTWTAFSTRDINFYVYGDDDVSVSVLIEVDYDTSLVITKNIPKQTDYDTSLVVSKAISKQNDYDTSLLISKEIEKQFDYDTSLLIAKQIAILSDYDTAIEIIKSVIPPAIPVRRHSGYTVKREYVDEETYKKWMEYRDVGLDDDKVIMTIIKHLVNANSE